jgi:hypothetical protein
MLYCWFPFNYQKKLQRENWISTIWLFIKFPLIFWFENIRFYKGGIRTVKRVEGRLTGHIVERRPFVLNSYFHHFMYIKNPRKTLPSLFVFFSQLAFFGQMTYSECDWFIVVYVVNENGNFLIGYANLLHQTARNYSMFVKHRCNKYNIVAFKIVNILIQEPNRYPTLVWESINTIISLDENEHNFNQLRGKKDLWETEKWMIWDIVGKSKIYLCFPT